MSHQTHYRSYRERVFTGQMTQPTMWKIGPRIRLQSHQVHPTVLIIIQLCSMKNRSLVFMWRW